MRPRSVVAALTGVCLLLAGCASSHASSAARAAIDTADVTFLQEMIPHHARAIEVAGLAASRAGDPRVSDFGTRIVREQSPELARMKAEVTRTKAAVDLTDGSAMAEHRITDTQLTSLRGLRGAAFDRVFVQLNITSEQGAVAMARAELGAGHDLKALAIARGIAGAPGEIQQLQTLLALLPGA